MERNYKNPLTREQNELLTYMKGRGILPTCIGNRDKDSPVCEHNLSNKITLCLTCVTVSKNESLRNKFKGGTTLKEQMDNIAFIKENNNV